MDLSINLDSKLNEAIWAPGNDLSSTRNVPDMKYPANLSQEMTDHIMGIATVGRLCIGMDTRIYERNRGQGKIVCNGLIAKSIVDILQFELNSCTVKHVWIVPYNRRSAFLSFQIVPLHTLDQSQDTIHRYHLVGLAQMTKKIPLCH